MIISDHRLQDVLGIQFVLEIREQFPDCKCAIVSGCLTPKDIEKLEEHKIPYYLKPLLYARVVEEMRNKPLASAPVYAPPPPEPEPESVEKTSKMNKRFGFWPKR